MLPTQQSLEDSIENLGKKAAKQFKQTTSNTVSATVQQITGSTPANPTQAPDMIMPQPDTSKATADFVQDLYAPSNLPPGSSPEQIQQVAQQVQSPNAGPQEEVKKKQILEQLQMELHRSSYYDPTFNRPKNQEEESVVEQHEKEKEEMEWLEQKKEAEKPPPLDVEVTRAEKFPGVSG